MSIGDVAPATRKLSFSFILTNLNFNSHKDVSDTVLNAAEPDQGEDGVPSIVKKEERKNKGKRKKEKAAWGSLGSAVDTLLML